MGRNNIANGSTPEYCLCFGEKSGNRRLKDIKDKRIAYERRQGIYEMPFAG